MTEDLRDVGEHEEQAEAEEPADRGQVAHDPRQQLAGLPAVVEGHRQPLQLGVEVGPDGDLDAVGGPGDDPAAHEHQHRLDDAEGEGQQAERVEADPVGAGDGAVDHRPGDQRDDDRRRRCPGGAEDGQQEARAERQQVAAQPPQVGARAPLAGLAVAAHPRRRRRRHGGRAVEGGERGRRPRGAGRPGVGGGRLGGGARRHFGWHGGDILGLGGSGGRSGLASPRAPGRRGEELGQDRGAGRGGGAAGAG